MIYLIRRLFPSGLARIDEAGPSNIKDYISNGSYSIQNPASKKRVELHFSDDNPYFSYASEINRFSSAMYESAYASSKAYSNGTLGWAFIQLYYSAFFASHSILRSLGKSFTYLDDKNIDDLNKVNKIYTGAEGELASGIYFMELSNNLIKLKNANSKDSHKVLWLRISHEIKEIQKFLIGNTPRSTDRDSLYNRLDKILTTMNNNSAVLTKFRNDVNYSQAYKLWLPSRPPRKQLVLIETEIKSALRSSISIPSQASDMETFLYLAHSLINLNHLIISEIDKTNNSKSSFLNKGALKVMRSLKISV